MAQINALAIQENLRGRDFVTVPWLQWEYRLSYPEAKEFMRRLIQWGWVESTPQGIWYSVVEGNMRLRKLRREEVDPLLEALSSDCINALRCIQSHAPEGADFDAVSDAVHGDDDAEEALQTLMERTLVYKANELYFPCVSQKTVRVLVEASQRKRRFGHRGSIYSGGEDAAAIRRLFEDLFGDS